MIFVYGILAWAGIAAVVVFAACRAGSMARRQTRAVKRDRDTLAHCARCRHTIRRFGNGDLWVTTGDHPTVFCLPFDGSLHHLGRHAAAPQPTGGTE